ncbi:MAG TPA: hypothetical protein VGJ05_02560 [Fimbriiglobus sp.]|jgi:hypothetical protein
MADVPAGPTFPIPEPDPAPPPPAAETPAAPAPPPWKPGGWNDPRSLYDRDGPKPFRWGPILVFGTLFLILGGILVALFRVPSTAPRPAVVLVPIWQYDDPSLPPNPWAQQDGKRLAACFPEDQKRPEAPAGRQELIENAAGLRSFISKLENQKSDRPFVCYFTAIADDANGVIIRTPKPGPEAEVTIAELLDGMNRCPAGQKLLVLDLARPLARSVTGPFRADPATALHEALVAYGPLPCPVLVSCSKGEVSVPMDPEGNSAFAFYLAEGLRGAADGSDGDKPDRDGRVTVRELFLFTAFRTNRWVAQVRGLTQTPQLYDRGVESVNFDVFIPSAFPARDYAPSPNPMPQAIADGWASRDARRADRLVFQPLAQSAFEGILLRAEAYWRAGDVERAGTEMSQTQTVQWLSAGSTVAKSPADWRYPTWATMLDPGPPAADKKEQAKQAEAETTIRKATDDYWRKLTAKPAKPAEVTEARDALKNLSPGSPEPIVRAVWTKLLSESEPPKAAIRDISALIVDVWKKKSQAAEQQLLKRLAALPDDQSIEPNAVAALLNAEDAAGRALAVATGDAFPAVSERLRTADEMKRQAEAKLFETEPTRKDRGAALAALKEAKKAFDEIRNRAGAVHDIRAAVREALWLLAATSPAAGENDAWYRDWQFLAKTLTEPVEKIFVAVPSDDPTEDWRATDSRVRDATARLRKRIAAVRPLAAKIIKDENPEESEIANLRTGVTTLRTALLTSALQAEDRKIAWDAVDKGEGIMHKKVRELDAKEDGAANGSPHAKLAVPVDLPVDDAPNRRVAVSLALARLGGMEIAKIESTWQNRVGTDPQSWAKFGAEVRAGWSGEAILKRVNGLIRTPAGWAAAERIDRATAPYAAGLFQPGKVPQPSPAERSARAAARAADVWLEQHFRSYEKLRPGVGEFYTNQRAAAARRIR